MRRGTRKENYIKNVHIYLHKLNRLDRYHKNIDKLCMMTCSLKSKEKKTNIFFHLLERERGF